jgi:hypothetical protein
MESITDGHLANSAERMLREGVDADTVAHFVTMATAHNREAVQTALAEAESMLERENVHEVRSMRFVDTSRSSGPSVH